MPLHIQILVGLVGPLRIPFSWLANSQSSYDINYLRLIWFNNHFHTPLGDTRKTLYLVHILSWKFFLADSICILAKSQIRKTILLLTLDQNGFSRSKTRIRIEDIAFLMIREETTWFEIGVIGGSQNHICKSSSKS
jgi:hypothetical protein